MGLKNLIGQRFSRLTVTERLPNDKHGSSMWLCLCDCGNSVAVRGGDLRNGHTRSCGCLLKQVTSARSITHGQSKTPLYRIWNSMRQRCENKNDAAYQNYGARGVTVCDEWMHSFQSFSDWAFQHGYVDGLTIDRKDNNGGYCPENCQWVTMKTQQNNKRNNHVLTFNGKTMTVAEWSDFLNVRPSAIYSRLYSGWSVERALSTPVRERVTV